MHINNLSKIYLIFHETVRDLPNPGINIDVHLRYKVCLIFHETVGQRFESSCEFHVILMQLIAHLLCSGRKHYIC